MGSKAHWEKVYATKKPTEVSWYQAETALSLRLIREATPAKSVPIIDVGGGASSLVDGLLADGFSNITVLDISARALAGASARLGADSTRVRWVDADILDLELSSAAYAVWHDRAVFHFLAQAAERRCYVQQVRRGVRPGGHVVIATFASDGPVRCSGLNVSRYSPDGLHAELGEGFELIDSVREEHRTPTGAAQAFVYCLFRVKSK
jgi:SAM-dependent methyltransferase